MILLQVCPTRIELESKIELQALQSAWALCVVVSVNRKSKPLVMVRQASRCLTISKKKKKKKKKKKMP